MNLTEDEAQTKWCPMHRVAVSGSQDIYGNMPNSNADTCAASLCMAWRFSGDKRVKNKTKPLGGWRLVNEGCAPGHEEWSINIGYCGLAGKP